MGNSRTRIARVLRFLERLFLLIAVVAIGFYAGVRVAAAREQASLSHDLDDLAKPGAMAATSERAPRNSVWRIEVPRLKLSAAAREGVDARTLRGAVGHIPGTALPGESGNAGFAAHRDTFFAPLRSVRRGDEVVVTTPLGVYRYAVTGTRIVEPEDLTVLDPSSEAVLTLVTCYPFNYVGNAPQRFIVRAALRASSPARTH
jgi:sortase A